MASYDKAVPPGGEGKITIQVKSKGYQGPIMKTAQVKTDDPNNSSIPLVIKAIIKVPIFISSKYVYLNVKENESATQEVEVRAELDKPLTLEPASYDLEKDLSYRIEEVEKGKKFKVIFTTLPSGAKSFVGTLKLKTNYPEMPDIDLRIRGRVGAGSPDEQPAKAAIEISNRFIYMYGVEGEGFTRTVDVKGGKDTPLELKPGEFSLEGKITYRIEEVTKGKAYKITFTCPASKQQAFNGYLKVKTNYPEMPEIVFQIRVVIRPKGAIGKPPVPPGESSLTTHRTVALA